MLSFEPKTLQAIAPMMGRVLIVDPAQASARLLVELLQNVGLGQAWTAASTEQALSLAAATEPYLIFTECLVDGVDGAQLTRRLRRGNLSCRKAPVIMIPAQATPASILAARDAGVHEFLRKPFAIKDLVRRIEVVATRPRSWVEAVGYVGPDRRRFNSGEYRGARRRRVDSAADPLEARIIQALKIVSAALDAIDQDRPQAFRALNVQAAELQNAGALLRRVSLVSAAHGLQQRLAEIGATGRLTREAVEQPVQALLAYLPEDAAA